MKKVLSVSIDEKVIARAKDAAHELRISFSAFVEQSLLTSMVESEIQERPKSAQKKLERSEQEWERIKLIAEQSGISVSQLLIPKVESKPVEKAQAVADRSAQKKLDEKRKGRNVKKEKIAKVKEKLAHVQGGVSLPGEFFNPQPKGGKK